MPTFISSPSRSWSTWSYQQMQKMKTPLSVQMQRGNTTENIFSRETSKGCCQRKQIAFTTVNIATIVSAASTAVFLQEEHPGGLGYMLGTSVRHCQHCHLAIHFGRFQPQVLQRCLQSWVLLGISQLKEARFPILTVHLVVTAASFVVLVFRIGKNLFVFTGINGSPRKGKNLHVSKTIPWHIKWSYCQVIKTNNPISNNNIAIGFCLFLWFLFMLRPSFTTLDSFTKVFISKLCKLRSLVLQNNKSKMKSTHVFFGKHCHLRWSKTDGWIGGTRADNPDPSLFAQGCAAPSNNKRFSVQPGLKVPSVQIEQKEGI